LGNLTEKEVEEFEIFCFGNPGFLKEVKLREQLVGAVKEKGEELLNPKATVFNINDFLEKAQKNWYYLAAAAMILVFLYFIPALFQKQYSESYLANFEENSYWENLLHQNLRSSEISISIQSPKIGENFENEIEFRWQAEKHDKTYSDYFDLIIIDNNESNVFQTEIKDGLYILEFKLEPGLYYWIVEYEKEMIHLGKFYYKKPN
jgi:hypothetical protein